MPDEKKEKTDKEKKEEAEKLKKAKREQALKDLAQQPLTDVAAFFMIYESEGWGENIISALEMPYLSALSGGKLKMYTEDGKEVDPIVSSLIGSRKGKKRLTGNISEYDIAGKCAAVIQDAMGNITVRDAYDSMKTSPENRNPKYEDRYLSELAEGTDEEKTFYAGYMNYFIIGKVRQAMDTQEKGTKKGLESLLAENKEEETGE